MNVVAVKFEPESRLGTTSLDIDRAADVFASLSNAVRLGVLLRVREREWTVNELADDLGISQSALSQHLRKLREVGIIRSRRCRQLIFYRCDNYLVLRLLADVGLLTQ